MRKYKAIHEKCGGQIAWIHNNKTYRESKNFERMDGTYPEYGSTFNEICPVCHQSITSQDKILIEDI